MPVAVVAASYAADGALLATSSKTSGDHLVSMVSKKDCALWRAFRGHPICKEREGDKDPYDVDYAHVERTVAEDGVHYAPPLRPAANTPATSWNAASYDPPTPPEVMPSSVAGAGTVEPTSTARPPLAGKPKATLKKPVKKPSPDQAGSGS